MGITTLKTLRLENAKLTDLFTAEEERWKEMAKDAKDYVADFIPREAIHEDDVIDILVPRLQLDPKLRIAVEGKKFPQNRYTWFGEYVLDKVWTEI
jgi:hypothetical protein